MLLLPALALAACQARNPFVPSATHLPAQPDDNFGFIFEYNLCYLEVLDTFAQTFRRAVETDPSIVIPVALTDDQMRTVYDKLVEINFFSYPAQYAVPIPENGTIGEVIPAYRYHLMVRNADIEHSVTWQDNIVDPNPPEAVRLRDLMKLIFGMVKDHPDVAKLLPSRLLCL